MLLPVINSLRTIKPQSTRRITPRARYFHLYSFFHRTLFFFLHIPAPVFIKQQPALNLILPLARGKDLQDIVQPALAFEPVMDLYPGAGGIFVHFAMTVLRTAAGSVKQGLGAHGDRADAAGYAQHAVPAGLAALFIPTDILVDADKCGINCRQYRLVRITLGKELNASAAGHGKQCIVGRLPGDQARH